MSLKAEFTKLVLMFIIQIFITIFIGYFYIMDDHIATIVLCMLGWCVLSYDRKG